MNDEYKQKLRETSRFYFATNDARTIASMLYGLTELCNDMHFNITPEGVTFSESLNRNTLQICGTLFAKQFDSYYHDGTKKEHTIYFELPHLYHFLSAADARDLVVIRQKKKVDNLLDIIFFRKGGDDERVTDFEMKLMVAPPVDEDTYEAGVSQVAYIMGVDTCEFVRIIQGFNSFDPEFHPRATIRFSCSDSKFQLRTKGNDLTITEAKVTVLRKKPVEEGKNESATTSTGLPIKEREPYEGHFRLRHLAYVCKCLNQNKGFIKLYLTNDQPLIMELDIGTLGIQRITFMYCSPDDEDFDDEELTRNHFFDAEGNKRESKVRKIESETAVENEEEEEETNPSFSLA